MKKKLQRVTTIILSIATLMCLIVFPLSGCGSGLTIAGQQETQTASDSEVITEDKVESVVSNGEEQADNSISLGDTDKIISNLTVKEDGKLKIAYLVDGLANESSQRHWIQVQNECEERGWELISDTNVSANYEADPTRNAFMNMMNQNPDAIVISYLDIPPIAEYRHGKLHS